MAAKKATSHGVIDAAARVAAALDELGARFALVGGLAVGARVEPRFTRDVDLAVSVADDDGAERLLRALVRRGYIVDTVVEQMRAGRLATARLTHAASATTGCRTGSTSARSQWSRATPSGRTPQRPRARSALEGSTVGAPSRRGFAAGVGNSGAMLTLEWR